MAQSTAKAKPTIPELYSGKSIFITGVTGFVGKVLLEKILRCCPDVKHVYVLLREKDSESYNERLDSLLQSPIFNKVKERFPNNIQKVIPVSGDVTKNGLDLTSSNRKILQDNVNIIYNCAATIRFDEYCRTALSVNLVGVKNILDFIHTMTNYPVFVHVSTAYSFCTWDKIHEELYPEVVQPDAIINSVEWMNDEELTSLCALVNKRPTIYHFSKGMAEHYINIYHDDIPAAIVRPSIITSSWKDPFPGWSDTFYGPSGLILACGKGIIRSLYVKKSYIADFVPVDIVVNALINSSYNLVVNSPEKVMIVNCTSSQNNPLTWGDVERIVYPLLLKYPSITTFRHPGGSFKNNYWSHVFSIYLQHWTTACIVDIVKFPCHGMNMIKTYRHVHKLMKNLEFFTTHQFAFYSSNMRRIETRLSGNDKQTFSVNMDAINWNKYLDDFVHGLRLYILKETDDTLLESRRRMENAYWVWLAIHTACFFTITTVISVIYPTSFSRKIHSSLNAAVEFFSRKFLSLFY